MIAMASKEETQSNTQIEGHSKKQRRRDRKRKRHNSASVDDSAASRETPDTANDTKSPQSSLNNDPAAVPEVSNPKNERKDTSPSQNKTQDNSPSTPPPRPKDLTNGTPKSPFKTPLRIHSSPSSLQKKVVQFNSQPDADDSSDEDFAPSPGKRRKFTLSKGGHSPNRLHTSPRKVHNKDELQQRKRDLLEERRKLPIWSAREPLLKMIEENQVTILLGETGCGKSTQLPQFLLSKYGVKGIIGITQPRRVAAVNLAKRVAEENGTQLRNKVGYSIRFDDATSSHTLIKFVTDGMLLRELQSSPNLSSYSVIILDEAHERSLRTDLLMGLIKLLLPTRPDLRVIVMSATLDAERFAEFFEIDAKKAEIGFVQGREYPVQVLNTNDLATSFDGTGAGDYVEGALKCILNIHMSNEEGDILVFLTGQNEIESLESSLNNLKPEIPKKHQALMICPLFAALPPNLQYKAFSPPPPNTRKIILATNIAETSVTVPGVRFVIDAGLSKRRKFNPQLGIETLQIHPISKSSAAQRAGRAGREAPGKCYRLYPASHFNALADNTTPEIRDCDITSLVLTLKIQGHDDILNFPFLDRPRRESVVRSLEVLYLLGALHREGRPTAMGKEMNLLPLAPELAKVLISSTKGEASCVAEVIDIIACMSASSASSNAIFMTPSAEKREESAENRKHFVSVYGDHITLLQAFREYLSMVKLASGIKDWCNKWGINRRVIKNVVLISYCTRNEIAVHPAQHPDKDAILKAFLSGYMMNTAFLQLDGSYRTSFSHHTVAIHPSSVLFNPTNRKKVEAIMYHELNYVRGVSAIEGEWFQSVAPGVMGMSTDIRSSTTTAN